jgi:hypothetical protein
MPAAGRHILARLQELRTQTELRMLRDPKFRALCDDYGAAVGALEHWKQSTLPEAAHRVSEYRALTADLEEEILREIGGGLGNGPA